MNTNHGNVQFNKNIEWGAMKHRPKFGHLAGAEPIVKPTHLGRFFLSGTTEGGTRLKQ